MHCQTSLNHTLRHLISTFGKSELSDRLSIPRSRISKMAKGKIEHADFSDLCTIADKCGFEVANIIEEKIDPICAEKYLNGKEEIIPERFLDDAFSHSITSSAILDNCPKFIRERAMRYLQLTKAGLQSQDFVAHQLNIELLNFLQQEQGIPYHIGQNTYFTYDEHPLARAFKGLSIKDSYDKLISEVANHVTETFHYELVKLNNKEAIFNRRLNPDLEIESAQVTSECELGFGSIIPVLAQGQIVEGKQIKSQFAGDEYCQYHFDFESAHPFFQYQ